MKESFITIVKVLLFISLCLGLLVSCGDDDDDDKYSFVSGTISNTDPSYGFMANSTPYHLVIDLGEREDFEFTLAPGMITGMHLKEKRTYVLHVVVLNESGRAISEYLNSFYIDDVPLDNQLKDFVCSWFVEFTSKYPESGFANNFGT
jgi:hypothetical protein